MPLSADRIQVMRASAERKLTMHCEIWRNWAHGEVSPGVEAEPDFEPHLINVPCYAFNYVRVNEGEFYMPERNRIGGDWRMFVPYDTDVIEEDEVHNIRLPNNDPMFLGPINIRMVIPHSAYKLVMMQEVR
jgi:hypothetical protein